MPSPKEPTRDIRPSDIRLSLCLRDGAVEIFSCETNTAVLLPEQDIDLLIANLKSFHQDRSIRETVALCPSAKIDASDKT